MTTEKFTRSTKEYHILLVGLVTERTTNEEAEAIRWAIENTKEEYPEMAGTTRHQEAIRWALARTQEPEPPPGGWPTWLPKPENCIEIMTLIQIASEQLIDAECRKIEKPGVSYPPPKYMKVTMDWALPILRRAVGTHHAANLEVFPQGPGFTTSEAMSVLESTLSATIIQETGEEAILPKPRYLRIALTWALQVLRDLESKKQEPDREPKIDIQALIAMTKREIRFWEETAEVSGKVTAKAATRAIRGLKGVLRYLGALPNS